MERRISPPRSRKRRRSDSAELSTYQQLTSSEAINIFSWNVNGISPFLEPSQPSVKSYFRSTDGPHSEPGHAKASLREFLRRHKWPTLLFLQEVKINPDDSASQRAVEKAVGLRSGEPGDAHDYESHFRLPSDKFNARGFGRKVYGVCSIIRKDFKEKYVDKIRPVSWDAEGRFLVIETKAVGTVPKLAIFNVYLVNGTDNPYKDPESGEVVGTRHDRKLAVHSLLQDECRKLEAEGFGVVIAGDMNIARSRMDGHPNLRTFPKQHCINRADFESKFFAEPAIEESKQSDRSKCTGFAMIDTFRHLHPTKKSYTFYPRTEVFGESCDRVDMILISRSLKCHLKEARMYETPSDRGPSDHVPITLSLDAGQSESREA